VKFGVEVIHMMPFSTDEFRENRYSANRCLLNGLDEMLPLFSTFSSDLDNIRCRRCPHEFIDSLWVSWKSARWKSYFDRERNWIYIRTCNIKYSIGTKFAIRNSIIIL